MLVRLHEQVLEFSSEDSTTLEQWHSLFCLEEIAEHSESDISITAAVVPRLVEPTHLSPRYQDTRRLIGGQPYLTVFEYDGAFALLIPQRGRLTVRLDPDPGQCHVSMQLTPLALRDGSFEDLTMLALAPLLRRRGNFLVHAAAVQRDNQAMLLIGPTRSGKTTTCMSLAVTREWRYLANDLVLLHENGGDVWARHTPGWVQVRPKTLQLLPSLNNYVAEPPYPATSQRILLSRNRLNGDASLSAAKVGSLLFPSITGEPVHRISSLSAGETLARLLEESADRWDTSMLEEHVSFLARLASQAPAYSLQLGRNMESLPQFLRANGF